jgi:hypothetical protein
MYLEESFTVAARAKHVFAFLLTGLEFRKDDLEKVLLQPAAPYR